MKGHAQRCPSCGNLMRLIVGYCLYNYQLSQPLESESGVLGDYRLIMETAFRFVSWIPKFPIKRRKYDTALPS
jgi:hypothetical protein